MFSAFGHRDLAKQVTLKVRLSGNLNTLPNTTFLTAWPWWRLPSCSSVMKLTGLWVWLSPTINTLSHELYVGCPHACLSLRIYQILIVICNFTRRTRTSHSPSCRTLFSSRAMTHSSSSMTCSGGFIYLFIHSTIICSFIQHDVFMCIYLLFYSFYNYLFIHLAWPVRVNLFYKCSFHLTLTDWPLFQACPP